MDGVLSMCIVVVPIKYGIRRKWREGAKEKLNMVLCVRREGKG